MSDESALSCVNPRIEREKSVPLNSGIYTWMISAMRDIVNNRSIPCWSEVLEEDAARARLQELNDPQRGYRQTERHS